MVKSRVLRNQKKAYVELPPEMAEYDEIELFQLRDGFYLMSVPLSVTHNATQPADANAGQQQNTQDQKEAISEPEKALLKKLLGIKFSDRTPANVAKLLDQGEQKTLVSLENKGLVAVYRGKNYTNGVYSIPDNAYALINNNGTQRVNNSNVIGNQDATQTIQPNHPIANQVASQGVGLNTLNSRGFLIMQDKREAMMLSEQLGQEIKTGAVFGIKGFDNKFYMVTRKYFTSAQQQISDALKHEMDSASIAATTKLETDGCIAVLRLMSENGDIIEKKKGIFAPV